jgi:hypothetical protein
MEETMQKVVLFSPMEIQLKETGTAGLTTARKTFLEIYLDLLGACYLIREPQRLKIGRAHV